VTLAAAEEVRQLSPRQARAAVASIVQRYFGERPKRLKAQGGGLTNRVYEFSAAGKAYIVRMHADPTKLGAYLKEQWATRHAREAGVPVPAVLEVSNEAAPHPYMICEKATGILACVHSQRRHILHELGGFTRAIHSVRTHGFGEVFDWSHNTLSRCARWADYLDEGFEVEQRLAVLEKQRVLDRAAMKTLRSRLAEMRRWKKPPVLQHGDMRLKNALVDPETGHVTALLDWENCLSAPSPYWDLAIALHDLGIDEKQEFADGYGLKPATLAELMPFLRALNLLHYAVSLEQKASQHDRAALAWERARLQGVFDLYRF
jgi:hygromycin-B 4-O-kinase